MKEEYCVVYGSTDENPSPFVIGVSKDQSMINGFREEHWHLCKGGEILSDGNYESFSSDYEIQVYMGKYMTPIMITLFNEYVTHIFNRMWGLVDNLDNMREVLVFDESDDIDVNDGLGFLQEILSEIVPIEMFNGEGSVYGNVLDIDKCLDKFLSGFTPEPYYVC